MLRNSFKSQNQLVTSVGIIWLVNGYECVRWAHKLSIIQACCKSQINIDCLERVFFFHKIFIFWQIRLGQRAQSSTCICFEHTLFFRKVFLKGTKCSKNAHGNSCFVFPFNAAHWFYVCLPGVNCPYKTTLITAESWTQKCSRLCGEKSISS